MPTVTAADRETAAAILSPWINGKLTITECIAAALAEQRERLTAAHVADLERIASDAKQGYCCPSLTPSGACREVEAFCRERIAELKGE